MMMFIYLVPPANNVLSVENLPVADADQLLLVISISSGTRQYIIYL